MTINCLRSEREALELLESIKKEKKRFVFMKFKTKNFGVYYVIRSTSTSYMADDYEAIFN